MDRILPGLTGERYITTARFGAPKVAAFTVDQKACDSLDGLQMRVVRIEFKLLVQLAGKEPDILDWAGEKAAFGSLENNSSG